MWLCNKTIIQQTVPIEWGPNIITILGFLRPEQLGRCHRNSQPKHAKTAGFSGLMDYLIRKGLFFSSTAAWKWSQLIDKVDLGNTWSGRVRWRVRDFYRCKTQHDQVFEVGGATTLWITGYCPVRAYLSQKWPLGPEARFTLSQRRKRSWSQSFGDLCLRSFGAFLQ